MIPIYRDVRKIQKCIKEDQIKSELNTFNSDLIIINYNQTVQFHIFFYHIQSQLYREYIL
jgi:hypothetical protein